MISVLRSAYLIVTDAETDRRTDNLLWHHCVTAYDGTVGLEANNKIEIQFGFAFD